VTAFSSESAEVLVTWGTWPQWVSAIVSSLAFLVAALSYRRSVRHRTEEQARLVYSRIRHIRFHDVGATFDVLPDGATQGVSSGGVALERPTTSGPAINRALVPLIEVVAVVRNMSKELIGPVKLQVVDGGAGKIYDRFCSINNAVEPESEWVVVLVPAESWYHGDLP
jgi:hypothetical protein